MNEMNLCDLTNKYICIKELDNTQFGSLQRLLFSKGIAWNDGKTDIKLKPLHEDAQVMRITNKGLLLFTLPAFADDLPKLDIDEFMETQIIN